LGQPFVSNGLPLTKLHHAAFDAQLIGIDTDIRIQFLTGGSNHNGPFLELGLKGIIGQLIQPSRRSEDRPDRERLALQFA
jgi:putative restriction endonuclease